MGSELTQSPVSTLDTLADPMAASLEAPPLPSQALFLSLLLLPLPVAAAKKCVQLWVVENRILNSKIHALAKSGCSL